MNNEMNWIKRQMRLGWALIAAGFILGLTGILLRALIVDLPFNPRIVTGLGILLIGLGAASLMRYVVARRDPKAARRAAIESRDERMQLIRARAGNRAFWVSTALAYTLLMWVSFADNGSLPVLNDDALWFSLAAVVVIPFGVYVASLAYDQEHR